MAWQTKAGPHVEIASVYFAECFLLSELPVIGKVRHASGFHPQGSLKERFSSASGSLRKAGQAEMEGAQDTAEPFWKQDY